MRRGIYRLGLGVAALALACGAYLGALQLYGNFHVAAPGELYRSAQLSPEALGHYIKEYHIKTVINLRGAHPGDAWYDREIAEAQRLGVTHIDYPMSAKRELTVAQTDALVNEMRNAPKPLLIHCRSGADRTGLASALYLAAIDKKSEWDSEMQLWVIYGHIPFIGKTTAMNDTFEQYEPKLGFFNS